MKVRFVVLGSGTHEVDVPSGSTVREAAQKAGIDLDGMSVKVSAADVVNPNDSLTGRGEQVLMTVAPKLEGGR